MAEALLRAAPPAVAGQERLAPFRAVLARLLPGWPAAAAREYVVDPVLVLGEAVLELLRVVAAGRRCLLLLDDLHWADGETLQLLEYLAPAFSGEPIVLVCAARDDESSPVRALRRRLPVLPLHKLPAEDVALLARHWAGGPASDDLTRFLAAAADGLPLLVEELFAGLVEDGRVRHDALGWHSAAPLVARVPEAFADVVRQRLDRLPDDVGHLVRTAAILGGEPEWRLVAAATGTDPGVVAATLHAAVDAELVRRRRRAALAARPHPRSRARRARPPGARPSLPHGGDRAEPGAGRPTRRRSGPVGRGGAPHCAAELLLRRAVLRSTQARSPRRRDSLAQAAALAVDQTDRTDAIAAERVRALALGGRVDEALAVGEQPAMRESRPVAVQMARACVIAERWERAHRWLDRAAPPVDLAADPAILALAAHVALAEGNRDEAVRLADAAVDSGTRTGQVETVCEALEIPPAGRSAAPTHPPPVRPSHAASGSPRRTGSCRGGCARSPSWARSTCWSRATPNG